MSAFFEFGDRVEQMKRMAERTGTDIGLALSRGQLGGLELRKAALSCASCGSSDQCSAWLSSPSDEGAKPAPDFCVNRALWDRLAQQAS